MKKLFTISLLFIFLISHSANNVSMNQEAKLLVVNKTCNKAYNTAVQGIWAQTDGYLEQYGHVPGAIEFFMDLEEFLLSGAYNDYQICLINSQSQ